MILTLAGVALSFAPAQVPQVPFPLRATGSELRLDEPVLHPDPATLAALTRLDAVTLTGVRLPSGEVVSLELERVDIARRQFGIRVDGVARPELLGELDLSVWTGRIAGDDASSVSLGFSNSGSRGWIRTRDGLVHLLAAPLADGSWRGAPAVLVEEGELNLRGYDHEGACATPPPSVPPIPGMHADGPPTAGLGLQESITYRDCPIAMETDWQLFQIFNDLSAETAYVTTLLSFISDRYELQTSTILSFPYLQFYTTSNDPWDAPDNGGSAGDLLGELRTAWAGNIPAGAHLGHIMSGAGLGGGVAYLDVLCNQDFGFGVSGNIAGQVNFPVVQQPSNWDFMVVAHELGHNFSSPHTHSFCPPLDECPPSQYFGSCQTQQQCTNMGTIMSYCHLCPGGTGNITTYFHPEAAALMRNASSGCNPVTVDVRVTAPDVASDAAPTQAMLESVTGTIDAARLNHRAVGDVAFTTVDMTSAGSGVWIGDLPQATCGTELEFWFDFDIAGYGTFTAPVGAPDELYSAVSGTQAILFQDDFEADLGWTTANLGASSGDWERAVPVNDPGWNHDPAADFDGSGACFVTDNQTGNTDVDGGAVALESPSLDLSDPNAAVDYAYYLRLTNSDGADRLLVEASASGGAWIEVARHDTDGGLLWRQNVITAADLIGAGVIPGPDVRFRFTANDSDPQSIVEAGLDGFRVSSINCSIIGTVYCDPAASNSTGEAATILAEGSDIAADNDVTLTVEGLPANTVGYFITSQMQAFVPGAGGSVGDLCVGGSVGRYNGSVLNSGVAGSYEFTLDLSATPQPNGLVSVMAGETWNFQSWYRDVILGFPTSNFSAAVQIIFL